MKIPRKEERAIPPKEELPAALLAELETIKRVAALAGMLPYFERLQAFMDLLPEALEEQLVMDREILTVYPFPPFSDPRLLRLAAATTNCWYLMRSPDPRRSALGTPEEMMRGARGLIGMLQLHLGQRLGLLKLVEGPIDPWDWGHPVRYQSYLPDLPEEMVRRGLWDPNPDREHAFNLIDWPEEP